MRSFKVKNAFLLAYLLVPAAAQAVDGVVLIDQSRANFGGITPGDAPGFPVTLSESGSYRLAGNLSANGTAIEITTDHVSVDLNGFRLVGDGSGAGVTDNELALEGIAVRNGTITGFGDGIALRASRGNVIEEVRALGNAGAGIAVALDSRVIGNTANNNGGSGIRAGTLPTLIGNNLVMNNVAINNGTDGISAHARSSLINNTANGNDDDGLQIECPGNIIENTAVNNGDFNLITDITPGCISTDNLAP